VKRREFVASALVVPFAAWIRPEALPVRRATFEEIGNSVLLTLSLPGLFRRGDREAVASIDSGFDTTLAFRLRVWKYGSKVRIGDTEHEIKIRFDPWKKVYLVRSRTEKGWSKREFVAQEQALAAATTLSRVRVAASDALVRATANAGPYYFVEVLAMRNPMVRTENSNARAPSERSVGRDLEWFARLVDVVAGERAVAEETVHVRTNPFYLPPR